MFETPQLGGMCNIIPENAPSIQVPTSLPCGRILLHSYVKVQTVTGNWTQLSFPVLLLHEQVLRGFIIKLGKKCESNNIEK